MKKLGTITIGQSPRNDVIPEIKKYLGEGVEVVESGALDELTYEEILEFKPEPGDYVLVSKLRDGRSVKFAEKYILPLLQNSIDKLEKEGVDIILFICTGVFPDVFKSKVPILYPQEILHAVAPALVNGGKIVVITPDKDQVDQAVNKWKDVHENTIAIPASPYNKEIDEFKDAIEKLNREKDISLVVMDCIGYGEEMKNRIVTETGLNVVVARTLVGRILGEILN